MKKTLIVLKHEFLQKVRSKAYIIVTLTGPILLAAMILLPALLSTVNTSGKKEIVVIDSTGRLGSYFELRKADSTIPAAVRNMVSREVTFTLASSDQSQDSLRRQVLDEQIDGYLIIPASTLDTAVTAAAEIRMRGTSDLTLIGQVERVLQDAASNERMKDLGIEQSTMNALERHAELKAVKISEGADEEGGAAKSYIAGYGTAFLTYISLLIYGATIMRSVIDEKSSRVIEVVVSSVKPYELLLGKVLGVALASLLQISVWALLLALATTFGVTAIEAAMGESLGLNVAPHLYLYFVLYFVLGFLIYATLYAAVGATADQESDTQQASLPITMLVVVPFILLSGVIEQPSSSMSTILSLIPFFSPILMMGRVFSETPPFWQIALSFVLMIGTFFGVLWVASRIYRVGILMYGKRFKIGEVIKWIRYS